MKIGKYQAAFATSCCKLTIDQVKINGVVTPDPSGILQAYVLTDGETDVSKAEFLSNVMSLNNKPFSSFAIFAGPIYDFEIDVTVAECTPQQPPLTVPQLFVRNNLGNLQAVQPDANGDYNINSFTPLPIPDANGFRRYYLRDAASCCILKRQPIDASGDLGIIPSQLRVYACGAGETYTEYSLPGDAQAINDFWSGNTCFNSFAIAPSFVSKIRLWSCDAEEMATVAFATSSSTVSETGGTHTVQVVLSLSSGTLQREVTVPIVVSPSSTANSDDYVLQTTFVTFPIGSANGATQAVNIIIKDDASAENNETIVLQLGTVSWPGTPGAITQHTVTITDDDIELNLRPLTQAEENAQSSGNTILSPGSVTKLSATTFRLSSGLYSYPGVGSKYTLNIKDNDGKCFRILSRTIVSGAPDIGTTGNREFTVNCVGGGGFQGNPTGRCVKQYGVDDMPAATSASWVLDLEVEFCNS